MFCEREKWRVKVREKERVGKRKRVCFVREREMACESESMTTAVCARDRARECVQVGGRDRVCEWV